jgi:hypothetical protein
MRRDIILLSLICMSLFIQAKSYEEFVQEMNRDYNGFLTQMDRDFAKALGREWSSFDSTVEPSYPNPKPISTPLAPNTPKEADNTSKVVINIINMPIYKNPPLPSIPTVHRGYIKLSLEFFSQHIELVYNQRLNYKLKEFNNHNIANYWIEQSDIEIDNFLAQIRAYQTTLNLNDWHLYLLIKSIANNIINDSNNCQLLRWFILNKLGYDVKLGYQKDESLYLLPNINQRLYNTQYIKVNGQYYYSLEYSGAIYTYPDRFSNTQPLNLAETKTPYLKKDIQMRRVSFEYHNKSYQISIPYNKNIMDLYSSYPSMDWRYYFRQPIDPITKFELFRQLKPMIQNMSELEAVNFLLHLTQYGFEYATDKQQFGRERSLFFEESLKYPYNDCEDRSIFFGKLVKEFLGLEVVALHYPNHLATAVAFKSKVKGESVIYKNRKYLICDPTYTGADVGFAMPQFRAYQDVKIIPIDY